MFGRFAGLAETLVAKARLSWGQHLRQKSRDLSIERDSFVEILRHLRPTFSIPIIYLDTIQSVSEVIIDIKYCVNG